MTATEFQRHPDYPAALRSFLASPAGMALREVLEEEHPARKLSRASVINLPETKRAATIATQAAAPGLIHEIIGYQLARDMILDTLRTAAASAPVNARRASKLAAEIPNTTIDH